MSFLYQAAWPILRHLDAERAHGLALCALKSGLLPAQPRPSDPVLKCSVFGIDFDGPVGLAAGFDKNAEVYRQLLAQGFGFVEIGSVTPRPQPGNPRPRLFRLETDHAVINRMGFNNDGAGAVAARLEGARLGPVGVNLGKNKDSKDAVADYVTGVRKLGALADYLVVNVSSPNTPGLRALQGRGPLAELLSAVRTAVNAVTGPRGCPPPLLLKIAPDLTDEDKSDIAAVVLDTGVDGLIITNTTIDRPGTLTDPRAGESGGLSGAPLFEPSTRVLSEFHGLMGGRVPLIGVGGIATAEQAYRKIRAGASLVQLYTAMVYHGPTIAADLHGGLARLLKRDGFSSIREAVGTSTP